MINSGFTWVVSPDCSRIYVDGDLYERASGSATWSIVTKPVNFTVDQIDDKAKYMTSTFGDLWKLSGGLTKIFTPDVPFPAGATVLSHNNRIGLGLTNSTSAWFVGME